MWRRRWRRWWRRVGGLGVRALASAGMSIKAACGEHGCWSGDTNSSICSAADVVEETEEQQEHREEEQEEDPEEGPGGSFHTDPHSQAPSEGHRS